jgi:hypothetical protein
MNDRASLMIATPAGGGLVHVDHVAMLLGLARAGVDFSHVTVSGERDLARARNALVSAFHARSGPTHLLFLDADVGLASTDAMRMLGHGRDVVAAPVPLDVRDPEGDLRFDVGRAVGEDGPLTLHERAGASVLLLTRRAVDALVDDAKARGRVYESATAIDGDPGSRIDYDVFHAGAADGEYVSGDARVCEALRRLGHAIHVDPTIVVRRHRIATL